MGSRRTFAWFALAAVCFLPGATHAEVTGFQITLSPYGGFTHWDQTLFLKDRALVGGRGGFMFGRWIGVEGNYGINFTQEEGPSDEVLPLRNVRVHHIGADVVLNLLPAYAINPYITGGWARLRFDPEQGATTTQDGGEVGLGLKIRLLERLALRLDARDIIVRLDDPSRELTHSIAFSGGLHLALAGKVRDTDGDGVGDHHDRCPDTPRGAVVDALGCPQDADKDGVYDGLDQCASTAQGAKVDTKGCPTDADADGVPDGIDVCATTPKGAKVDAKGCPIDSDADRVPDGIDQCASTPVGATVNDIGCPLDSDHDGVYDGIDLCANTGEDVRVDKNGCPIEVSEKETQLLDTGMIRLNNINFDTGKANIKPESFAALNEVGTILVQWPQLQIEIGGHTDSRGSDAYNQQLSQKRAQSVLNHLTTKFPSLSASQYTAKGYGESKPIESNASELGRAKNRRVEFKVLNREVLRKEIDRRKILKKDGD